MDNKFDIPATKVIKETLRAMNEHKRLIANKGGTRSGKTYGTLQLLIALSISARQPANIDIVSESLPHLKRGALNDFKEILAAWGGTVDENKTDLTFTFATGSEIRFFSADNWGKVKGSRRDILFLNEANRIDWEIYRQLDVRTTGTILIDWNPDSEFWYEAQGLNLRDDTTEIVTTYKDNPFLEPTQIAAIEAYKNDERWWKVYGRGETGTFQGLIYTDWEQCRDIPQGARLVGRGLDFGFTNDPTAIVAVYMQGGELWLDEELYTPGLTNDKIADHLKGKNGIIIADSAEMKSIAEIRNYGIRHIEPCVKGADSVRNGIQVVQRYKLHVTQRSLNLIKELRNYKWAEDKVTGEMLNRPDKNAHFDHALDAVRYLVSSRLNQSPRHVTTAHSIDLERYGY